MRLFRKAVLCVASSLVFATGCASAPERDLDLPSVTRLVSSTNTELGAPIVGLGGAMQVTAQLAVLPVGARLPVHMHPHPRYTYLLAGTLRVRYLDAGKVVDYQPGAFVIETPNSWHFGESIGTEPVRLLVIDEAPPGGENMILRD